MSLSHTIDSYGVVRVHGTGLIFATDLLVHAQLMAMYGLLNRQYVFDLREATLKLSPSDLPMIASRVGALHQRHGQALTVFVVCDAAAERLLHAYAAHCTPVGVCVTRDIETVDIYLGHRDSPNLSEEVQGLDLLQPQLVWPLVDTQLPLYPGDLSS